MFPSTREQPPTRIWAPERRSLAQRVLSKLSRENRFYIADLSEMSGLLCQMIHEIRRRAERTGCPLVPVVLENHTKALGDMRNIRFFAEYVARQSDIEVVRLRDLAANLKGAPRVLILSDNFVSGSRIWRQFDDRTAAARPQLLFCNNSRRPSAAYHLRLLASLASLLLQGECSLGLSVVRRRPRVSPRPLDHPSNQAWLQSQAFELGLHNMGIIYKQETIDAFRLGILNAHIGYLPGMRGRSVLEWSLVYGVEPCVSTFFIDQGVDTGAVIVDRYLPPQETVHAASSVEDAKCQLFHMDGLCYRRAITTLQRGGDGILNRPVGVRFYVMSELLAAAIARS